MALDYKQKALLELLLAKDPTFYERLYNWEKVKTYDDEIKKYEGIIYKAEAYSETAETEKSRNEAKKIAEEARALLEERKKELKGLHGFSTQKTDSFPEGAYVGGLEDFGKEAIPPGFGQIRQRGGGTDIPVKPATGAAGKKDLQIAGTIAHELRHGNWTGEEEFLKMLQTPKFGGTGKDARREQEELLQRYYDMKYDPEGNVGAKNYIEDSPYYHKGIYDKLEGSLQVYLDSIKPEGIADWKKAGGGLIDKPLVGRSRYI